MSVIVVKVIIILHHNNFTFLYHLYKFVLLYISVVQSDVLVFETKLANRSGVWRQEGKVWICQRRLSPSKCLNLLNSTLVTRLHRTVTLPAFITKRVEYCDIVYLFYQSGSCSC